jgi:hypothetical protein
MEFEEAGMTGLGMALGSGAHVLGSAARGIRSPAGSVHPWAVTTLAPSAHTTDAGLRQ